jgi:hypothetical protein
MAPRGAQFNDISPRDVGLGQVLIPLARGPQIQPRAHTKQCISQQRQWSRSINPERHSLRRDIRILAVLCSRVLLSMVAGSKSFFQREEASFVDCAIFASIILNLIDSFNTTAETTTVHLGKLSALDMAQRGGHCC